jgi:dCTP deaminase
MGKMVLCDSEIRAALKNGQLVIKPDPPREHITTSAVDLMLGEEFMRWKKPKVGFEIVIDPALPEFRFEDAAEHLEEIRLDDGSVVIRPKQFILAITHERVEFPITSRLAARVEGRSTLARLGLGVHVTAPTIHAGFKGQIALELTNQADLPIKLTPGMRICQLIVEMAFGTPSREMTGIFQDQSTVLGKGEG